MACLIKGLLYFLVESIVLFTQENSENNRTYSDTSIKVALQQYPNKTLKTEKWKKFIKILIQILLIMCTQN